MKEIINIDDTFNVFSTATKTIKLITEIIKLSNIYHFNSFKTNYKVLTFLQESSNYGNMIIYNPSIIIHNNIINYGKLHHLNVYLDSNMKWDDTRIIPIYDNDFIRSIKISRIKNKKFNFNILEELQIISLLL